MSRLRALFGPARSALRAPRSLFGPARSALRAPRSLFGPARFALRAPRSLFAPPDGPPFRQIVAEQGWYPLVIITALNLVDELDRAALAVFAPNIRRFFGISNTTLGAITGIQVTLLILAAVPIGYLGSRANRARILRWSAAVWALFSFATSLAVRLPFFVAARIGTGIGKAAVEPVGRSLLTDYYPPQGWNRVLAAHNAANPVGNIVGPLLAGGIGVLVAGDAAWRWAFPLLTVPTIVALVMARRLREPANQMVKGIAAQTLTVTAAPTGLGFRAAIRKLVRIPTFKRQLVGIGVLGFALVGLATFGSILYEEEFGIGEGGRGVIAGVLATAALGGTLVGGRVGERVFHRSPSQALYLVGGSIAVFSVILGIAVLMPWIVLTVAILWVATFAVSVGASPLGTTLSAISLPNLRPLMFSLLGLFVALFGGFLGGIFVGAVADATNIRVGLASVAPFGVIGGLLMARGGRTVESDIAKVEREFQTSMQTPKGPTGRDLALRVRHLDFAYGDVQVLFEVDLDVEEGEIVALLGTNGAGKSTLLRAVCGLELPAAGSVAYFGEDVTWDTAEEKVRKGMIQVPGGRGTFPSLTVVENLRMGAYTFRDDRKRVARMLEEVFAYFPVLHQRQEQPAGTLSGGEQQMLALGRAFMTSPRLLMIDELTLGLAPVVIEELVRIVRAFHERGTTLVLVEQSVNIALELATTAYFMERGQIRFGGPASKLLARTDLLRSVFLEGAGSVSR